MEINVQAIKIPVGVGGTELTNIEENIFTKRSIIQITNDDNLCLARAIVVALVKLNKELFLKDYAKSRYPK